ncbi:MAG: multicopper oxidase family protein [Terrimicrobiaceae bacterium]
MATLPTVPAMEGCFGRTVAFLIVCFLINAASGSDSEPVRLFVKEVPLTVLGKEVTVVAIEQLDGTQGYSPERTDGFHVEVVNQLKVPTSIHWHGLVLPNSMDGVPFVTQNPIAPGESFRYDFPLKQSGTYWMHSHYGLQEQLFNAAPMIIWTPEERAKADRQLVVTLSDFSFTPPGQLLMDLKDGMQMARPEGKQQGEMEMGASGEMPGVKGHPGEVAAQKWDDQKQMLVRTFVRAPAAEVDVRYDALLANRHTLDDPEIIRVKPGQSVLLRIIAAASATNYYVNTGALEAEILAADGKAVRPIKGTFFQLGTAQRLDLKVSIPKEGGAFPILAQGEGTKLLCGVVLATEGAPVQRLSRTASASTAALDNTQERRLHADHPLEDRQFDRALPAVLAGDMAAYVWKINDAAYPNGNSLDVRKGERVGIVLTNTTNMGHPMHLHGHDFEVVEIDGDRLSGALRDTVLVPPGSKITVAFDADNPGVWAFHCHLIYHLVTGMFTVVKYDGADLKFWQPEKQATELQPQN